MVIKQLDRNISDVESIAEREDMVQEFVITVISSAGVSSLLAVVLIFLSKSWVSERLKSSIKSEYDQKLETHKAQLKAQTDIEVEKLKSDLNIIAAEQRIKFSTLHNDRADVIAKTYTLLKNIYFTVQDYIKIFEPAGDKPRAERRTIAVDANSAFRDYYTKKLIYFPKITAEKLENINNELVKIFNDFTYNVDFQKGAGDTEKWSKIFEKMNGEMHDALEDLEDEFRKLLGDKTKKDN